MKNCCRSTVAEKSFACRAAGTAAEGVVERRNQKICSNRKNPEHRKACATQANFGTGLTLPVLRLSELKNLRLEQLHLDAGFISNVIGKGSKERVVPVGRKAVESLNRFYSPKQFGAAPNMLRVLTPPTGDRAS